MNAELEEFRKTFSKVSSFDELKMVKSNENDNQVSEVNYLDTAQRLDIAQKIISNYSMLKKQKGILHEQIFSAMEDYLEQCGISGIIGLSQTRLFNKNRRNNK